MLALSIQQGLIEDDTKAAARQSPNCIKKRNNKIRRKHFQYAYGILSPCSVTRGSGTMRCHWIRPNVRHIGILLLVSISTMSPQSTCHSAPVCEILSKSDYQSAENKWRHVDFQDGGSLPSWILGVVNRDHSSKLLSFWENRVLQQTDRQTDGQPQRIKPLSLSLNNWVIFEISVWFECRSGCSAGGDGRYSVEVRWAWLWTLSLSNQQFNVVVGTASRQQKMSAVLSS